MRKFIFFVLLVIFSGLLPDTAENSAESYRDAPMKLIQVREAEERSAVCNDGSPSAYYFRRGWGTGRHRWVIHLQGGGMCVNVEMCKERSASKPKMMTSRGLPLQRVGSGIQSSSPRENPDFYSANHVYVHYCSSDLWSGDREATRESGGWHFRGARIVRAVIDDLINPAITSSPNLADATEVLFSGGSAGGVGVMVHLDWLAERLPHAKVRGLNDAGWAVDLKPYDSEIPPLLTQTQQGYAFWKGVVDASCAQANPGSEGRCYLAYVYPYITTPLFVQQAQFDRAILKLLGVMPPLDERERAYILEFADAVRSSLEPVRAVFSPATPTHSLVANRLFRMPHIAGHSLQETLSNWFFDRPGPIKLVEQMPSHLPLPGDWWRDG